MGLDIYAGPVSRYVAGDWLTIVQQAGQASGMPVEVVRTNEPDDAVRDVEVVRQVVGEWRADLLGRLGVDAGEAWDDSPAGPYETDKPDWDGYGAVVLLAAYDERPDLAPGAQVRKSLRRTTITAVTPRNFGDAPAYQAATKAPARYPTILRGAEWCFPLTAGPAVFVAPTPNGSLVAMGRVDRLLAELTTLNDRTLRLSPADLAAARHQGPPAPDSPVADAAPFGLSVLLALAEFAATHSTAWIMDY